MCIVFRQEGVGSHGNLGSFPSSSFICCKEQTTIYRTIPSVYLYVGYFAKETHFGPLSEDRIFKLILFRTQVVSIDFNLWDSVQYLLCLHGVLQMERHVKYVLDISF